MGRNLKTVSTSVCQSVLGVAVVWLQPPRHSLTVNIGLHKQHSPYDYVTVIERRLTALLMLPAHTYIHISCLLVQPLRSGRLGSTAKRYIIVHQCTFALIDAGNMLTQLPYQSNNGFGAVVALSSVSDATCTLPRSSIHPASLLVTHTPSPISRILGARRCCCQSQIIQFWCPTRAPNEEEEKITTNFEQWRKTKISPDLLRWLLRLLSNPLIIVGKHQMHTYTDTDLETTNFRCTCVCGSVCA